GTRDYLSGRPAPECGIDLDYGLSVGGVFVIRPDAWWSAGGMDERLTGWGSEDVAVRRAADTLLGKTRTPWGSIVHLGHPPSPRFGPDVDDGWDLAARYAEAEGNPAAMCALVAEGKACRSR